MSRNYFEFKEAELSKEKIKSKMKSQDQVEVIDDVNYLGSVTEIMQ